MLWAGDLAQPYKCLPDKHKVEFNLYYQKKFFGKMSDLDGSEWDFTGASKLGRTAETPIW